MKKVLNNWDLNAISELFSTAGKIALNYFNSPPAELKSDQSVVTVADREIEQLFAGCCDCPSEQVFLIGEETIASHSTEYINSALAADCCWILDPIDGTAPYSAHLELWGISLGLMRQGRIVEGAVYLPCLDTMLITSNGQLLSRSLNPASEWREFAPSQSPLGSYGHIAIGQTQAHSWCFDGSNQLFAWSSCVGALYWLLSGRVIAYCGDFKLWDIAGFLPILNVLGYPFLSATSECMQLSCDLADGGFILEQTTDRWRVKSPFIAAPDRQTALNIMQKFHPAHANKKVSMS